MRENRSSAAVAWSPQAGIRGRLLDGTRRPRLAGRYSGVRRRGRGRLGRLDTRDLDSEHRRLLHPAMAALGWVIGAPASDSPSVFRHYLLGSGAPRTPDARSDFMLGIDNQDVTWLHTKCEVRFLDRWLDEIEALRSTSNTSGPGLIRLTPSLVAASPPPFGTEAERRPSMAQRPRRTLPKHTLGWFHQVLRAVSR